MQMGNGIIKDHRTQGANKDMNLIDGLNIELKRAKKLLLVYQAIPTGGFGVMMTQQAIDTAETCMREEDTAGMIVAYGALKALK